jgi:single-strand DNA-binding protein
MTNLNRITLLGNTGSHDPKHGATQSGKECTRLTMATNARFKDDAGNWQERATWHNIAVFGSSAEYAANIPPGSYIFVEGCISTRSYEKEIDTPRGRAKVQWPVVEVIASSISVVRKAGSDDQPKKEAAA